MGRPKCHSRPLGQSDELCIMVHFVFMMHSHWVSARGVLSVANVPSTFRFVLFVCSCGRERASGSGHPPSPSSASWRVPDIHNCLICLAIANPKWTPLQVRQCFATGVLSASMHVDAFRRLSFSLCQFPPSALPWCCIGACGSSPGAITRDRLINGINRSINGSIRRIAGRAPAIN